MARLVPTKIGQAGIAVSPGTLIYTAPTLITTVVKCIDVANTTASPITVSVHLVPSAGTATTSNALFYTISVPGNGQYQWTGTQILAAAGFIQAIAASTGLTINIAGGEYSAI
jgi:hypothetical protein